MSNPVLILGGKSLGKVAVDIFKSNNVLIYGILDDDKNLHGKQIDDVSILGSTDDTEVLKIIGKKCDAFIASDDTKLKKSLVKILTEDYKAMPVNGVHQKANVSESVILHHGCMINAGCHIGAYAEIGNHCLLNTGSIIENEAYLSDFVQVGAGSVINQGVKVGEGAFIGSGVTIISGITIGKNARVGAGSVVIENVKDGETVFGNPAKSV